MKQQLTAILVAAVAALSLPALAFADETPAPATAEGALPHGPIGGDGWLLLPEKERVARVWRALPRAERVAREKNGTKPPILGDGPEKPADKAAN